MTPEEQWRAAIEKLELQLAKEAARQRRPERQVEAVGKVAGVRGVLRATAGMTERASISFALRKLTREKHSEGYEKGVTLACDAFSRLVQDSLIDQALVRAKLGELEHAPEKRAYNRLVGMKIGKRVTVIKHIGPERYLCQCVCGHEWERAGPTLRNLIDMGTPAWCPAKCVAAERKKRK